MSDAVDHPKHYNEHPSGIECIDIVEHHNFCVGNALKYLWRAGLKGPALEDLKKARWYLDREIARLSKHVTEAESDDIIEVWPRLAAIITAARDVESISDGIHPEVMRLREALAAWDAKSDD